jgi:hypothetical protein
VTAAESGAEPDPESDADRPTIAPFLGALAVIVLVVIGIVAVNAFSDDGPTPEQELGRAAVAQNDALQRSAYQDFVTHTCGEQHGVESEVLARQRDSVDKRGERYVDGVSDAKIDGDNATATVTYHFNEAPDTKVSAEMRFVRDGQTWKVCSPGPS